MVRNVTATLALLLLLVSPAWGTETEYQFATKWGREGSYQGSFGDPHGIAVDSAGNVYVADSGNYRIEKFSHDGRFITTWGSPSSGSQAVNGPSFVECHAIAVDSHDVLYLIDVAQHTSVYPPSIKKFAADGTYLGWLTSDAIAHGNGIAVDRSGNIYVTLGNVARKLSPDGALMKEWGAGRFGEARGIAVDSAGNVYVSDGAKHRVEKYTPAGDLLAQWGSIGSGPGQFNYPGALAIDGMDNLYVVDGGNNRVQKLASDGTYLTQWGSPGVADGQFDGPMGIAVSAAGEVFVTDQRNQRVQRFATSGEESLPLAAGWNFIALTVSPSDPATDKVLSSIGEDLKVAWSYDEERRRWLRYRPADGEGNTLRVMAAWEGYWLYMDLPATLAIRGIHVPPSLNFHKGWNLIGNTGPADFSTGSLLESLSGNWSTVWVWEDGEWSGESAGTAIPIPHIPAFQAGKAFWVYVRRDAPEFNSDLQSRPRYLFTLTKPAGYASIADAGGRIRCAEGCTFWQDLVAEGDVVTLKPTYLAPHAAFSGWSGSCSGTGDCSVVMDSAKTVAASYRPAWPRIAISPASNDYGSLSYWNESTRQTFLVTNTGTGDLTKVRVDLSSDACSSRTCFRITRNTCAGATLPPSGTCQVDAVFSPNRTEGAKHATLWVSSSDDSQIPSQSASLAGEGFQGIRPFREGDWFQYQLTATVIGYGRAGSGSLRFTVGRAVTNPYGVSCRIMAGSIAMTYIDGSEMKSDDQSLFWQDNNGTVYDCGEYDEEKGTYVFYESRPETPSGLAVMYRSPLRVGDRSDTTAYKTDGTWTRTTWQVDAREQKWASGISSSAIDTYRITSTFLASDGTETSETEWLDPTRYDIQTTIQENIEGTTVQLQADIVGCGLMP